VLSNYLIFQRIVNFTSLKFHNKRAIGFGFLKNEKEKITPNYGYFKKKLNTNGFHERTTKNWQYFH
jgi:hypothetical protein